VTNDLALLKIEIETQWTKDSRGRLLKENRKEASPPPHLVIAASAQGHAFAISSHLPDDLATALGTTINRAAAPSDPALAPVFLHDCAKLLKEAVGPVEASSGPSYLVPPATTFTATAEIVTSDSAKAKALHDRNPRRGRWTPDEWRQLLDGDLGPWAFAMAGDEVVSICHSARLAERGAEAGTWTDPDHRGRGHAAATTAAWASLLEGSGRHLFYSTSAANLSSQRVAARLGLPCIGWLWKLSLRSPELP
jgi:RimJ/RimL family protein N-acetyltransferase